ncbi:MAG: Rieske 2Fe-2S domain-containing protein [Opitutales bacterium]
MSVKTTRAPRLPLPGDCTFAPEDWQVLARFWYPVAFVEDLVPGTILKARLLDEELVVYRTTRGYSVAKDLCIHRGAPISKGWLEGDEIVCAYHGFRYAPDGQCTRVPAQPDARIPKNLCLRSFPAVDRYGMVWTCLAGEEAARIPIPDWGEFQEPDRWKHMRLEPLDWACSASRHVENFNDVAHLSWLHTGTFGNPDAPEVRRYEVDRTRHGFHFKVRYPRRAVEARGENDLSAVEDIVLQYDHQLPFYTRLTIHFPDGTHYIGYDLPVPTSRTTTRVFYRMARDFDLDGPADYSVEMQKAVLEEDRPVVEAQRPEELPLDLSEEFHIAADRFSAQYRRALKNLGLGQPFSS